MLRYAEPRADQKSPSKETRLADLLFTNGSGQTVLRCLALILSINVLSPSGGCCFFIVALGTSSS